MLAGKTSIGHQRLHLLKMNTSITMTSRCNTIQNISKPQGRLQKICFWANTQEVIHQKDARGENLVVTCFTGAPAQLEQYLDDNETC